MIFLDRHNPKKILIPNFVASEFFCKCGECDNNYLNPILLDRIHLVRKKINLPLTITSGFRCKAHNKEVGGVENSYHTIGQAVDFKKYDNELHSKYLLDHLGFFFEYIEEGDNYIHCDIRNFYLN